MNAAQIINVIRLGYIGLPTVLMLSSKGVKVVGTDFNKELISTLISGKITFEEKGLRELFQDAVTKESQFTSEYIPTDTYIIAVPTPYEKISKKIDPKYVIDAVESIMNVCLKSATLVIESIISPGTIYKLISPLVRNINYSMPAFVLERVHQIKKLISYNYRCDPVLF